MTAKANGPRRRLRPKTFRVPRPPCTNMRVRRGTPRAAMSGDRAARFAAITRVFWFGGYLREVWLRPSSHAVRA